MADLPNLVERLSALTLPEASELAKMLEDAWGVSAARAIAPLLGEGPAVIAEPEQTEFDIMLTSYGDTKVQVVRVIRGITGIGLKESMDMVNQVPVLVKGGISKEDAVKMKAQIEEVGGTVEIK